MLSLDGALILCNFIVWTTILAVFMPSFYRLPSLCLPCLAGSLLLATTVAAEELPGCPVMPADPIKLESVLESAANNTNDILHVSADRIELQRNDKVMLSGNVVIIRGGQRIVADKAVYDKNRQTLDATGNVHMENLGGDRFSSNSTFFDLQANTGFSDIGDFTLRNGRGRGHAERIVFVSRGRIKLKAARFTTCPANKEVWYLKAAEFDFDQNAATGTARHARLRFMGLPIFYMPYMSFPLGDHRRSGFLLPEFGSSDTVGTYFTVPYYWNIAPNYDATFRPRYMSRRGVQLQSEFRYLGKQYQGTTELEVLPNDAVTGGSRLGATYRHQHRFGPHWTAGADIGWVSDTDYFNDFSTQLSRTSQTHLSQTIETKYQKDDWKLAMFVSSYQTLDTTATDPFTRLPQLVANWHPSPRSGRMNYEFHASATDFRHDTKESARRLHLRPSVSFPVTTEYGHLTPRLSLYSTAYANRSVGTDTSVMIPVGSIDSGLIFERSVGSGARLMIQTLEPRLFFVYAPHVLQDTLPLFDTSLPTFTFNSLFQENRFIGSDRLGDSQQFTLALTSRLIDDGTGSEKLSASIGQTFYLADRLVSAELPAASPETAGTSDLAAEITAWLGNHWYVRSSVQWDTQARVPKRNNHFLQYQPAKDLILNLGYRFENGVQELFDISTQWPLTKKWMLIARSQYSLKDNRNQDSYAGLVYNSCCWSLRTVISRRIDQNSVQINSVAFQLILKGLAGFESGVASESPLKLSVFH